MALAPPLHPRLALRPDPPCRRHHLLPREHGRRLGAGAPRLRERRERPPRRLVEHAGHADARLRPHRRRAERDARPRTRAHPPPPPRARGGPREGLERDPRERAARRHAAFDVSPHIGGEAFYRQLDTFVRACRSGAPPFCSLAEGLNTQRMIDAIYASAALGAAGGHRVTLVARAPSAGEPPLRLVVRAPGERRPARPSRRGARALREGARARGTRADGRPRSDHPRGRGRLPALAGRPALGRRPEHVRVHPRPDRPRHGRRRARPLHAPHAGGDDAHRPPRRLRSGRHPPPRLRDRRAPGRRHGARGAPRPQA